MEKPIVFRLTNKANLLMEWVMFLNTKRKNSMKSSKIWSNKILKLTLNLSEKKCKKILYPISLSQVMRKSKHKALI